MEFQLLRTMDWVSWLDLGLYFHSAVSVTASWLSVGGLSGLLLVTSVVTFARATSARLSLPLTPDCKYSFSLRHTWPGLSCFVPPGRGWFHSPSLLWPPMLVPSHPEPAPFHPCWTHSLVLTWFPWNGSVHGVCCLDITPLQIMTLCTSHSVYNDKVSEIGEVPKLLDKSLDCQYTPLGHTNLPRWFKQDNLRRAELLDNFSGNFLLKLWFWDMAWRRLEVDMKVT